MFPDSQRGLAGDAGLAQRYRISCWLVQWFEGDAEKQSMTMVTLSCQGLEEFVHALCSVIV